MFQSNPGHYIKIRDMIQFLFFSYDPYFFSFRMIPISVSVHFDNLIGRNVETCSLPEKLSCIRKLVALSLRASRAELSSNFDSSGSIADEH